MAVRLSHEPVTENRETASRKLRLEPVVASRPLIYTKDGHIIEEWVDGEIRQPLPNTSNHSLK